MKSCEIIGMVSWNVNKNLAWSCVRFKQILKSYFGHISNYGFVWCYFTTNISRSCVLTVVMCELEKEDFWNQMTFLLSWAHFRSSCAVIYNFLYKVYIGQLCFSNILGRNFDQSFYNIQRWLSIILYAYVIVLWSMLIWFVKLWKIFTILIKILQNINIERHNTLLLLQPFFLSVDESTCCIITFLALADIYNESTVFLIRQYSITCFNLIAFVCLEVWS